MDTHAGKDLAGTLQSGTRGTDVDEARLKEIERGYPGWLNHVDDELIAALRDAWRERDLQMETARGIRERLAAGYARTVEASEQRAARAEAEVKRLTDRDFEMHLQFDTKLGDLAQRNAELEAAVDRLNKILSIPGPHSAVRNAIRWILDNSQEDVAVEMIHLRAVREAAEAADKVLTGLEQANEDIMDEDNPPLLPTHWTGEIAAARTVLRRALDLAKDPAR